MALTHLDSVAVYANGLSSVELSQQARLLAFLCLFRSAYDALGQANMFAFEPIDSAQIKLSEAIIAARTDDYRRAYNAFLYFFNNYAGTRQFLLTHPYTTVISEYYRQQSESRNEELRSTRTSLIAWIVIALLTAALAITVIMIYRRRLKEKGYQSEALLADIEHLQKIVDTRVEPQAYKNHYAIINSLCEIADCMPDTSDGYALLGKNVSRLISTFRTDETLTEIENFVNEHFDGLMKRFREQNPDFTDRNYKYVLLSFAGFSSQSITIILNIKSPNALRTMRHRIKKQIEDSKSADCGLFLSML